MADTPKIDPRAASSMAAAFNKPAPETEEDEDKTGSFWDKLLGMMPEPLSTTVTNSVKREKKRVQGTEE